MTLTWPLVHYAEGCLTRSLSRRLDAVADFKLNRRSFVLPRFLRRGTFRGAICQIHLHHIVVIVVVVVVFVIVVGYRFDGV